MTTCKRCNQEKPDSEFPWLKNRYCHDCMMWVAMNEMLYGKKRPISEKQREVLRKAREKRLNHQGKSLAISTEATKTGMTTEKLF